MSNFFHSDCDITDGTYKGWGGWVGSQKRIKATIKTQTAVVCVQQVAQTATIHRTGQDTDSSSVCPVSGTNSHNPQDRPRQSLATVRHHTHPY